MILFFYTLVFYEIYCLWFRTVLFLCISLFVFFFGVIVFVYLFIIFVFNGIA